MKWYEVLEDMADGSYATRRFKTREEADTYVAENEEWCRDGVDEIDTESSWFWTEQ
jgi:hypothetical protein